MESAPKLALQKQYPQSRKANCVKLGSEGDPSCLRDKKKIIAADLWYPSTHLDFPSNRKLPPSPSSKNRHLRRYTEVRALHCGRQMSSLPG